MMIAISLYSFNQESSYTEFPITAEGLADARELLDRDMAKGHDYRISPWQFEGSHGDAIDVKPLVASGNVEAVAEFVRTRAAKV